MSIGPSCSSLYLMISCRLALSIFFLCCLRICTLKTSRESSSRCLMLITNYWNVNYIASPTVNDLSSNMGISNSGFCHWLLIPYLKLNFKMKPNVGRPPNPPTNLNSVKPRIPTNGPIKPSSGSLQKRASEVVPSSTKGRSIEKKLPVGGSSSKIETVSTVKPNFITKNIASSKVPKSSLKGSIPAKDWKLDWAGLPEGVYVQIFQFVCKTVWDVFKLLHVCRGWREVV